MVIRIWVAIVCAGALISGCGSSETPKDPGQPAGEAAPGTPAGGGSTGGDCPLTEGELADATSLSWKFETAVKDRPLETMETVKVTACVYTAPKEVQTGGDPLVLRVDLISSKDAETIRAHYSDICVKYGGTERAAAGGMVCDRDGVVGEGYTGNLVTVTLVGADKVAAVKLTPSFEKVLAAAR